MLVKIALFTRQAKGNWSIEPPACLCTSNVARQDAAESARSGIFSRIKRRWIDCRSHQRRVLLLDLNEDDSANRRSGQKSRSKSTKGNVTSIGLDIRPSANKIVIIM